MPRWSWILVGLAFTPACGGSDGDGDSSNGGSAGSASGGTHSSGGSAGSASGGTHSSGGSSVGGNSSGGNLNGGSAGAAGSQGIGGSSAGSSGIGGSAGTGGSSGIGGSSGSGGGTSTGPCTSGARRCNGLVTEVCNGSGTAWIAIEACANSCSLGVCTGGCEPGALRCNGNTVQECAPAGASWDDVETCPSYCHAASAQCAEVGKVVTGAETHDGVLVVDGTLLVKAGARLSSLSGDLTIYADSIIVEAGGVIDVAPTGEVPVGAGGIYNSCYTYQHVGGGGSYGTQGTRGTSSCGTVGSTHGSPTDFLVTKGSKGGDGGNAPVGGNSGKGGGVLRLIATEIIIDGRLEAKGQPGMNPSTQGNGGGGGSGGGILVAADSLKISGLIEASGGAGGKAASGSYDGGAGGNGRIKLLYGGVFEDEGVYEGTISKGLIPPLDISSATVPSQLLHYNDDFSEAYFSWSRPLDTALGYYYHVDQSLTVVPTPANATWVGTEGVSVPRSSFAQGVNYFHTVSVNSSSAVGEVQGWFRVNLNTKPPVVTSSSHPSQSTWYTANPNAFFAWTIPVPDDSVVGYHWVRDKFADTVPTASDSFISVQDKQLIQPGLPDGVHFFHVVSLDRNGHFTKAAGHYQVRIGADPGTGVLLGKVLDGGNPVVGALVEINRGLASQVTDAGGNYNFNAAIAGAAWEVRVSAGGYTTQTATVEVVKDGSTLKDFNL